MYAYRKHIDAVYTHELRLPDAADGQRAAQELATLGDGRTIVVLADGATLPAEQPPEIAASIEALSQPLPDGLRDEIKAASSLCRLIAQQVIERIRAKYPLDEELYFARIAVGALLGTYTLRVGEEDALAQYQAEVEAAREWGWTERAKLGL